jgi:hypothetical protein
MRQPEPNTFVTKPTIRTRRVMETWTTKKMLLMIVISIVIYSCVAMLQGTAVPDRPTNAASKLVPELNLIYPPTSNADRDHNFVASGLILRRYVVAVRCFVPEVWMF